jgi:hypothetical protein
MLLCYCPQHFLYFFPLPQGQGSLRPIFGPVLLTDDCKNTWSLRAKKVCVSGWLFGTVVKIEKKEAQGH